MNIGIIRAPYAYGDSVNTTHFKITAGPFSPVV